MTLQQLRYLHEVVEQNLNISKAAQAMNVSQPGLSRQLQLLEHELEVELFVRNGKRLARLSNAGRHIVSLAGRMLNDARNIQEAAREHAGQDQGALTIASTHTQVRYALPAVVKRFAGRYPDVQLSLRQGTPSDVSHLVSSGAADLSIAAEPIEPHADLVYLPCYQLQRILLAPPGHPLLKIRRPTLEKLAAYPLITYDFAFNGRSKIMSAFDSKSIVPHIVLNAIDADVIKTYVEAGLGIAIVPEMVYEPSRNRTLRRIAARHLFGPTTICIGIRRGHYLRGYIYALIEMFAPHLSRPMVERAIMESVTRDAPRKHSGAAPRLSVLPSRL